MYVIVTDAKGFEIGYDTGTFMPSEHRVLIEKGTIYGAENFTYLFRKNGVFNQQEWAMFCQLIMTLPSGTYGQLSWKKESS